jgi:hypothetical protein
MAELEKFHPQNATVDELDDVTNISKAYVMQFDDAIARFIQEVLLDAIEIVSCEARYCDLWKIP